MVTQVDEIANLYISKDGPSLYSYVVEIGGESLFDGSGCSSIEEAILDAINVDPPFRGFQVAYRSVVAGTYLSGELLESFKDVAEICVRNDSRFLETPASSLAAQALVKPEAPLALAPAPALAAPKSPQLVAGELLAVVGVEKDDRVICQALGCGHGVYRRIHVVRHTDGHVGVYGSDCFERLFGGLLGARPKYGNGDGRELTPEERLMLAENTDRLIALFAAEQQAALEIERQRREIQEREQRAALEAARQRAEAADRRRPLTAEEIAPVEAEAKDIIRRKFNVNPDSPGWRGLVLIECRRLLGR